VLAIQVGSGVSAPPGPVTGTAVPAAVWTVDPATGRVETSGRPPGAPSAGEVKRAASALARGLPAASVGELDYAEREIMHPRTAGMPAVLTGGLAILLVLFAARYGFGALYQVLLYTGLLSAGVNPLLALGGLVANLLLVAGIVLSVALLLNFRGAALRAPGFSSPRSGTRTAAWVGLAAAMAVLVAGTNYALPRWLAGQQRQAQAQTLHISVTAADDGTQVQVSSGGYVRVDLRAWPGDEWPGVRFSVSNPSVLGASSLPAAGDAPVATFDALSAGASRIDADSRDGRYSFELRVMVVR
jgi:hypothetical protein